MSYWYWHRYADRLEAEERDRQAWIAEVKQRLGLVCTDDEPGRAELADYVGWPRLEEGVPYAAVSEHAMASRDGVNFYVKPDGMPLSEFWNSIP